MNIEEQVAGVFSAVFGRKIKANDDVSIDTEDLWDSLKHIELIMTLEEELDISFDKKDIPTLTSMAKIIENIEKKK